MQPLTYQAISGRQTLKPKIDNTQIALKAALWQVDKPMAIAAWCSRLKSKALALALALWRYRVFSIMKTA